MGAGVEQAIESRDSLLNHLESSNLIQRCITCAAKSGELIEKGRRGHRLFEAREIREGRLSISHFWKIADGHYSNGVDGERLSVSCDREFVLLASSGLYVPVPREDIQLPEVSAGYFNFTVNCGDEGAPQGVISTPMPRKFRIELYTKGGWEELVKG